MGRKHKVTVLLSDAELQRLSAAAAQVGTDLALYLRAAANNAAGPVAARREYTREQLMSIHRRAALKGHVWTQEELRRRGLPLYWCEDWVRARIAEGRTRVELAVESGHPERALTAYLRRVYGLRTFDKLTESKRDQVREQVAAGRPRDEVAAELKVSVKTVTKYVVDEPGVYERRFRQMVEAVGTWPASTRQIADACFEGDMRGAQGWCDGRVKYGRLRRIRPGWYEVVNQPQEAGPPEG